MIQTYKLHNWKRREWLEYQKCYGSRWSNGALVGVRIFLIDRAGITCPLRSGKK